MNENIRVRFIGDISALRPTYVFLCSSRGGSEQREDRMQRWNLAANYGGRAEITRAARIGRARQNGELPEDITEETPALYTGRPA